jgi:hypothetical protein
MHRVLASGRREASRTILFGNRVFDSQVIQNSARLAELLEKVQQRADYCSVDTTIVRQQEQHQESD